MDLQARGSAEMTFGFYVNVCDTIGPVWLEK
jgi:hypothetical protein